MKILVTGSAGFIGSELTLKLLTRGDTVVGIDNHNDYYDPAIKEARVDRFIDNPNYTHIRADLTDHQAIEGIFTNCKPEGVVNLAAQAGVRYSIENPLAYINSNIVGFAHILEGCRHNDVEHLVYASTSSVYGANTSMPFSVHQNVDHPLSVYSASKKSNELMAHTYSHLYGLSTTGLRFFTVYGPWGRPDMALFLFTKAILLLGEFTILAITSLSNLWIILLRWRKLLVKKRKKSSYLYKQVMFQKPMPTLMIWLNNLITNLQPRLRKASTVLCLGIGITSKYEDNLCTIMILNLELLASGM